MWQVCRGRSHSNVTINGLLPGQFNTDRINSLFAAVAKRDGKEVEDVRAAAEASNPTRRLGETNEFGQACLSGAVPHQDIWLTESAY